MVDVRRFQTTETVTEKLGRRGISVAEARVIEQTHDPTTWLIVTGWESTNRERKMLRR
jgi:hypothetical protein